MRCVGYRQVWEYLDGAVDYAHHARQRRVRDAAIVQAAAHARLRSMEERVVVDCCDPEATARARGD